MSEAVHPEPGSDADRDPAGVARAGELAADDGDWNRFEDAGWLMVSLARIQRKIEAQEEDDSEEVED